MPTTDAETAAFVAANGGPLTPVASLVRREPLEYSGLSFFDLPRAHYAALVDGMADEHRWHFENNDTGSHLAFLRSTAPELVEWSRTLRFPRGSVHLDLGGGEGILSYIVARRGYQSICVELSATILHSATLFQAEVRRRQDERSAMHLWVANIYDLPLPAGSVDFVTIKQVLHHLEDLDGLMREVSRVLKPGGIVYVWEPFFLSIPVMRGWMLRRRRRVELSKGVHHVHHTYWTYRRLFRRWLTEPTFGPQFAVTRWKHHVTRTRFTGGSIHAHGRMKPYRASGGEPAARVQIQPRDFLREDLLPLGLELTRHRKELVDRLMGER